MCGRWRSGGKEEPARAAARGPCSQHRLGRFVARGTFEWLSLMGKSGSTESGVTPKKYPRRNIRTWGTFQKQKKSRLAFHLGLQDFTGQAGHSGA